MESPQTFGGFVRQLRLQEARMGLRAFADLLDMEASNLSSIEAGRAKPPANPERLKEMADALGLSDDDPRRGEFFTLAAKDTDRVPVDVADACKSLPGVPVLVRTVANKQLGAKQLRDLADYISRHY